jgi:hypothetical protein
MVEGEERQAPLGRANAVVKGRQRPAQHVANRGQLRRASFLVPDEAASAAAAAAAAIVVYHDGEEELLPLLQLGRGGRGVCVRLWGVMVARLVVWPYRGGLQRLGRRRRRRVDLLQAVPHPFREDAAEGQLAGHRRQGPRRLGARHMVVMVVKGIRESRAHLALLLLLLLLLVMV